MSPLILGSTSIYRRQLLARLGLPFTVERPDVDETMRRGESATGLVARLAREKADAVTQRHPGAVVIGADQVCVCGGEILGKPGSAARARAQLGQLSGREVEFLTAICVRSPRGPAEHDAAIVPTRVRFRDLSREAIERYVAREMPLDCAGSFKVEALGIALFERVHSDDPTALIGLPLISLCRALRAAGLDPLA